MQLRDDFTDAAVVIIGRITGAGFEVRVHHMCQYVEVHAVHLSGDEAPHVAKCEGDGDAETYQAARALAAMVGIRAGD
jgi:hypothetical protein